MHRNTGNEESDVVVSSKNWLISQMSPTRKKLLILLCIFSALFFIIRYLLFNGELLATQSNYRRTPGMPVLVTVYYEALCPDSKHFILKQLQPTYKKLAPFMDIQLIPYGKAETFNNPDGTYKFDCQHGPVECQANIYHSCSIEVIEDPQVRLDVIACMIRDNRLSKEAMHKCAKQHNVENIDLIQKCYDSSHGGELLKLNGDATHALRPSVTFIPTITLDGSQSHQAGILKKLFAEICKIIDSSEKAEAICKKGLDISKQ